MRIPATILSTAVALCSVSLITHAGKPQKCADGQQRGGSRPAACTSTNTPPGITILSPTDGARFEEGAAIALSARATDAEDGDISARMQWQPTPAGGTLLLPAGDHTLSASVTDSGGLSVTQQVVVTVTAPAPSSDETTLSWQIPTTRENGEPLSPSELTGFEIYVTREATGTGEIIHVGDPLANRFSMKGLAAGSYDFAISAIDANGLRSQLSNVVTKLVQ